MNLLTTRHFHGNSWMNNLKEAQTLMAPLIKLQTQAGCYLPFPISLSCCINIDIYEIYFDHRQYIFRNRFLCNEKNSPQFFYNYTLYCMVIFRWNNKVVGLICWPISAVTGQHLHPGWGTYVVKVYMMGLDDKNGRGSTVTRKTPHENQRRCCTSIPSPIKITKQISEVEEKLFMTSLKGQCHEIFCLWFFSWISFPPAPEYCI